MFELLDKLDNFQDLIIQIFYFHLFPLIIPMNEKTDKKVNFSANTTSTNELVQSDKSKFVADSRSIDLDDSLNQRKRTSLPMVDSLLESKKNTINDQLNNSYFSTTGNEAPEIGISSSTSEFNGNKKIDVVNA